MNMLKNKIAGSVYGFAIGDAMGATTEFMDAKQIKAKYGKVTDIIGGGWLNLKAGQVTDDTQMTICVMDALMNSNNADDFQKKCMENFIAWLNTKPKDVGGQCYKGISYYAKNYERIPEDENSLGNGSLMRAMPCALVENDIFNVLQGKLTHNNFMCSLIIIEYASLIKNLLDGNLYIKENLNLLEPSGYIVNTFNNAKYWAGKNSFEEAIIGAVNHGGDADTIAAITGSIAGARFGYNNIPKEWIEKLDKNITEYLDKFINYLI